MQAQHSADLNSTQQFFAADEYVVSVLENGVVVYEEVDELSFNLEAM